MIIEKIHIDSFGKLHDFDCSFGPRLNIVEGENESGKSTLAAFIRFLLYGFPAARGNEVGEKRKRLSWQNGRAGGSMTLTAKGKRYRVERFATASSTARGRETYRESYKILDAETGTPVECDEQPGVYFLGVPEEIFLSTAFVGQVDTPRVGGASLNEAIENLLFSGDENVNVPRALDQLDALRRSLLHKNGKGGLLYDLGAKEADLTRRLAAAEEQNAALLSDESELSSILRRLEANEAKLREVTQREREEDAILTCAAYDRLHEAERQNEEADRVLAALADTPAYACGEGDLTDLAVSRRTEEETRRRYREACEKKANLQGAGLSEDTAALLERVEKEGGVAAVTARIRSAGTHRTAALAGAAVLAAGGIAALITALAVPAFLTVLGIVLCGALLAGAGALAYRAWVLHRRLRAIFRDYGVTDEGTWQTRRTELEEGRRRLMAYTAAARGASEGENSTSAEYTRARADLAAVLSRFGAVLPEDEAEEKDLLDRTVTEARSLFEERKKQEAAKNTALGILDTLRGQLAGKDEDAARAALPQDRTVPLADLQLGKWRDQITLFRAQQQSLLDKRRELENATLAIRGRAEDPAVLDAELAAVREELRAAKEQHAACQMAYDAISGAGARLRGEISPRLSAYARGMMQTMTGGKYREMGVGGDLAVSVMTESGTHTVDYLSTGTQDLAYLSLRMALIDLLYKEKPPVCFDESFAHLDDDRTRRALGALAAGDGGQQTLVFTCHRRERDMVRGFSRDAGVISLAD